MKPPGQEVWKGKVRVERPLAAQLTRRRQVPGRAHGSEGEPGMGRRAAPAGGDGCGPVQSYPKHLP